MLKNFAKLSRYSLYPVDFLSVNPSMLLKLMLPTKSYTKEGFVSIIFSTSSSERLKLIQQGFFMTKWVKLNNNAF